MIKKGYHSSTFTIIIALLLIPLSQSGSFVTPNQNYADVLNKDDLFVQTNVSPSFAPVYALSVGSTTVVDPPITDNSSALIITDISTRYDQLSGSFHLFGEIMNTPENTPVSDIKVNATFFNSKGEVISSISGYSFFNFLNPGEKSAFDIAAYDPETVDKLLDFSFYKVSSAWSKEYNTKPAQLDLKILNVYFDLCGNYHIAGIVSNFGKETTRDISISGAFYNERGQIIMSVVTSVATYREPLTSFAHTPFHLVIEKQAMPHFSYFAIYAQSADYAATTSISGANIGDDNQGGKNNVISRDSNEMTIFTDSPTYKSGLNTIKLSGSILFDPEGVLPTNTKHPLVSVTIMTAEGSLVRMATAPVLPDGSFTLTIDLLFSAESQGQVYVVTAEYQGIISHNTFGVAYDEVNSADENSISDSTTPISCDSEYSLVISRLDWRNADDDTDQSKSEINNGDQVVSLQKIKSGTSIVLNAVMDNVFSKRQPVVMVMEIRDSGGMTVFLETQALVTDPIDGSTIEFSPTWTPQSAEKFTVKSFAITNTSERPLILSAPVQKTIDVI
jgi:hypothetical protein